MSRLYESIEEVHEALKRRGCVFDREVLAATMNQLDLHPPLGDQDVGELKQYLSPGTVIAGERLAKLQRILASAQWVELVSESRRRLRIPAEGMSAKEALARHDDLLSAVFPLSEAWSNNDRNSALSFWGQLVIEARNLCVTLGVDPTALRSSSNVLSISILISRSRGIISVFRTIF